jgi:prepilin-type N-terminal cleavage/methylation domain-containing protein
MNIKRLKFNKKKGFSLIEIVVALGISVITLTGSAVFSTQLITRAQDNFMEVSALQLQGMITEQLRLLESGLKNDVANNRRCTLGPSPSCSTSSSRYLPVTTPDQWARICSNSSNTSYRFAMNFPVFNNQRTDSNAKAIVSTPASEQSFPVGEVGVGMNFYGQTGNTTARFYRLTTSTSPWLNRFGAFETDDTPVFVNIEKIYENATNLSRVIFRVIIRYEVLGQARYTRSQEIQMVHSLICTGN